MRLKLAVEEAGFYPSTNIERGLGRFYYVWRIKSLLTNVGILIKKPR